MNDFFIKMQLIENHIRLLDEILDNVVKAFYATEVGLFDHEERITRLELDQGTVKEVTEWLNHNEEENISYYTKIINDFALNNPWLKLVRADERVGLVLGMLLERIYILEDKLDRRHES